jgi:hypothetical protein
MRKPYKFTVPLYGDVVWVFGSKKQMLAFGKKQNTDFDVNPQASGVMSGDGGGNFIVGVFDGQADTVVHEATHLALAVAERHGLTVNKDHDEGFCYLMESLFNQIRKGARIK